MTSSTQRFHNFFAFFFTLLSLSRWHGGFSHPCTPNTKHGIGPLRPSKEPKQGNLLPVEKPHTTVQRRTLCGLMTFARRESIYTRYGSMVQILPFLPLHTQPGWRNINCPIHIFSFWFYPESCDMEFLLTWPQGHDGYAPPHPLSYMMTWMCLQDSCAAQQKTSTQIRRSYFPYCLKSNHSVVELPVDMDMTHLWTWPMDSTPAHARPAYFFWSIAPPLSLNHLRPFPPDSPPMGMANPADLFG